MGIKFLCSQCGKKLNVKSFLAGKRGICPHCGAGVDIPGEKAQPALAGAAAPSIVPAERTPSKSVAAPSGPAPVVGPVSVAVGSTGPSYPGATPAPVSPAPQAMPAVIPVVPRPGTAPSSHVAVPAGPAIAPMPPAMPSAPLPPVPHDPISEAPNAVWYVRPPSGGQFGPAPGETMRKWIGEGRVTADSLVWREGWADWKKASSIFPQLGAGAGNEPMVITGPSASGRTPTVPRTPSSSTSTAIILIVALVVLIIPLIIALVYMISQGGLGSK